VRRHTKQENLSLLLFLLISLLVAVTLVWAEVLFSA